MPMLLLGAFAGVMSEAVDRKRVMLVGQIVSGVGSATIAVLAAFGVGTAMACRRGRIAGRHGVVDRDVHPPAHGRRVRRRRAGFAGAGVRHGHQFLYPADRSDGGGAAYQALGLAGAYGVSAGVYSVAIILVGGLEYRQSSRRIVLSHVPRDLAEAFAFARGHVIIGGVLAVTIAMNLLGFCYSALVAPIGRQVFMVSPALTGMLAGAEAFGALLGGLWLTGGEPRLSGRTLMVGGSLMFLCA